MLTYEVYESGTPMHPPLRWFEILIQQVSTKRGLLSRDGRVDIRNILKAHAVALGEEWD